MNARESLHDLHRVEAGLQPGRVGSPAAPAQRVRESESPAWGAARHRSGDRRAQVGVQVPHPVESGRADDGGGLVFSGDADGNMLAMDSRSGKLLWHYQLGSNVHGTSPTTYMLDGRQYVLVPAGTTLVAFALPRP